MPATHPADKLEFPHTSATLADSYPTDAYLDALVEQEERDRIYRLLDETSDVFAAMDAAHKSRAVEVAVLSRSAEDPELWDIFIDALEDIVEASFDTDPPLSPAAA